MAIGLCMCHAHGSSSLELKGPGNEVAPQPIAK